MKRHRRDVHVANPVGNVGRQQESAAQKRAADLERTTGFEPATLTLAKKKVMDLVRRLGSSPLSGLFSAGCSAQSAELAPLRWPTLNALNLYQRECWASR